jgi:hypothetical protein
MSPLYVHQCHNTRNDVLGLCMLEVRAHVFSWLRKIFDCNFFILKLLIFIH